jgi:hypothetical protein
MFFVFPREGFLTAAVISLALSSSATILGNHESSDYLFKKPYSVGYSKLYQLVKSSFYSETTVRMAHEGRACQVINTTNFWPVDGRPDAFLHPCPQPREKYQRPS